MDGGALPWSTGHTHALGCRPLGGGSGCAGAAMKVPSSALHLPLGGPPTDAYGRLRVLQGGPECPGAGFGCGDTDGQGHSALRQSLGDPSNPSTQEFFTGDAAAARANQRWANAIFSPACAPQLGGTSRRFCLGGASLPLLMMSRPGDDDGRAGRH